MIYFRGGRYDQNIISENEQFHYENGTHMTVNLTANYIFTNERYFISFHLFFIWTLKDTNQKMWIFKTRVKDKSKTNVIKWMEFFQLFMSHIQSLHVQKANRLGYRPVLVWSLHFNHEIITNWNAVVQMLLHAYI